MNDGSCRLGATSPGATSCGTSNTRTRASAACASTYATAEFVVPRSMPIRYRAATPPLYLTLYARMNGSPHGRCSCHHRVVASSGGNLCCRPLASPLQTRGDMAFQSVDEDALARVAGGFRVRLTQYGYRNDPDMDRDTAHGRGAYRNLQNGSSIALTDSTLFALGLTKRQVRHEQHFVEIKMKGGGSMIRRIDDRAPQRSRRADLYMPGGLNRH